MPQESMLSLFCDLIFPSTPSLSVYPSISKRGWPGTQWALESRMSAALGDLGRPLFLLVPCHHLVRVSVPSSRAVVRHWGGACKSLVLSSHLVVFRYQAVPSTEGWMPASLLCGECGACRWEEGEVWAPPSLCGL